MKSGFVPGLDMCDVAYKWGLDNCLNGMFACTPYNSGKMVKAMEAGDYVTAAMNMLGYDGDFAQDYNSPVTETAIANVRAELIRIGELKG